MSDQQPGLIAIEDEPIPGTRLHRRRRCRVSAWENICPEYLGPALNELQAIKEASEHGFGAVMFAGSSYVRISGTWYLLNLPVRNGEQP
jgi:hypothetical protein